MANKRQTKKNIYRVCADIAELILPSSVLTHLITEEQADEILQRVSQLHAEAISRMNIVFDKAPSAFDNMRAYHTARKAYFSKAYAQAIDDFSKGINEALQIINKANAKQ